jgi:hypothetical protein
VLAASSQHFQELFEQCSSARDLVVILDGTSPVNLRALLEFMYKGEVYIDDANLNSFLQTAKRLQVCNKNGTVVRLLCSRELLDNNYNYASVWFSGEGIIPLPE